MTVGYSNERRPARSIALPPEDAATYAANLLTVGGITLLGILFVLGFTQAQWPGPVTSYPAYEQLVRNAQLFHEVLPYFVAVPPATFAVLAWLCVFALWGAYLTLIWRVRGLPVDMRIAVGGAIVLGVTAVITPPVFSTDTFSYAVFGRIASVYQQNPYLVTPRLAATFDPLMPYLYWKDIPSPYGPLWTMVSQVIAAGPEVSPLELVLRFKLFALTVALLDGWLVYLLVRDRWPLQAGWLYLGFAWNPLLLIEGVVIGHNDVLILALLLASGLLLLRARPVAAIGAMTVSALIKYSTVPLIGLASLRLLLRTPVRGRPLLVLRLLGTAIAITTLGFLPFWSGYQSLLSTASEPGRGLNNIPFSSLAWLITRLSGGLLNVESAGRQVLLASALFLGWQTVALWRTRAQTDWTVHDELATWGESLMVFLFLWPRIHTWYYVLPLGLLFASGAALKRKSFWFFMGVTLVSYYSYFH